MTSANQKYQEEPYVRNVARKTRIGNPFFSKEKINKSPRLKLKSKLKFLNIIFLPKNSFQISKEVCMEMKARNSWTWKILMR